jgi:uncharacterized protein (DUF362 family)
MAMMRREFLNRTAQAVGIYPFLVMTPPRMWGHILFEPEAPVVPAKPLPGNPFVKDGKSLVVIIHGMDPGAMLRAGIELIGGMEPLGLKGKRVVLKPNVVNNRPPPTITSPAVVKAAAQVVKQSGASDVVVGDSSGIIRFPTRDNLKETGVQKAAEEAGARVLALEDEPWVRVQPEQAKILEYYFLSKPVYDADVIINLPVVKTHRFASYSCCLKNFVGIVHPKHRPSVAFLAGSWHERIAELNLAVHPLLNIADGTTIMIAGGPTSGTPARTNLLLLSGDRVALDVVALSLIRYHKAWDDVTGKGIWEQRQIKKAVELGLGVGSAEQIELVNHCLDGPNREFEEVMEFIRRDIQL